MTHSFPVERLTQNDFPELMAMLHKSFQTVKPDIDDFEQMYPDVYQPSDEFMAWQYAIRQNGRIAACVGLIPVPLLICDRTVTLGGIAGVGVLPEFRGRGLMQAILDQTQNEMLARGYPFSCLGGFA
jgi:predicted acetyltransferase